MARVLTFVAFLLVASLLVFSLHYYLWARLVRDPAWPQHWQTFGKAFLITMGILIPTSIMIGRFAPEWVSRILGWSAFIWAGMMFLFFVTLSASELPRLLGLTALGPDESRRLFLSRTIATLGLVGVPALSLFGVRQALQRLFVKDVDVTLKKLPKAFDGLTIAQLTDIHIGPTIGRSFIEEMVQKTNALRPDIIAITGDLVDGTVEQLRDEAEPLRHLRAKYGVYFVTGNHEYYSGVEEWVAHLQTLGVRVLRNECVSINEGGAAFDLAGIDDYDASRFGVGPDLPGALAGRNDSHELVLLAHQPRALREAAAHNVGLMLSGHTHGGQIWPFNFFVKLQCPWVLGWYREKDTLLYVSPGTGYWGPPMRLGTRAEITRFTLKSI